MDTIEGWKEILKVFGVQKSLWYLINGSLERRVKHYLWEKNAKGVIDFLTSLTLTEGVIKAINFLNGGPIGETVLFVNDETKFLSRYFVDDYEKDANAQSFY